MFPSPPWLNISPQLYLGAAEAGAQTGLAQRRQDTTEQEAADRLQLNYLQLQEQAKIRQQQAAETLRAHNALEQYRQSEILNRQQAMAQQAQANEQLNLYRQGEAQRDEKRIGLAEQGALRAEDTARLAQDRYELAERHQQYLESLNTNKWSDQQKAQVRWLMQQEKNLSTPGLDEFGNSDRAKLARKTRVDARDKISNTLKSIFTNPAGTQFEGPQAPPSAGASFEGPGGPPAGGKVRVLDPDGKRTWLLPAAELQEAIGKGYKPIGVVNEPAPPGAALAPTAEDKPYTGLIPRAARALHVNDLLGGVAGTFGEYASQAPGNIWGELVTGDVNTSPGRVGPARQEALPMPSKRLSALEQLKLRIDAPAAYDAWVRRNAPQSVTEPALPMPKDNLTGAEEVELKEMYPEIWAAWKRRHRQLPQYNRELFP